jgi:hypothetical protein
MSLQCKRVYNNTKESKGTAGECLLFQPLLMINMNMSIDFSHSRNVIIALQRQDNIMYLTANLFEESNTIFQVQLIDIKLSRHPIHVEDKVTDSIP